MIRKKSQNKNKSAVFKIIGFWFSSSLFRYNGIYKVVQHYPVIRRGLKVWTFALRRDDDSPAPWTTEGKRKIEELDNG